ncbi:hypothetical protein GCM10014715_15090 [Streptomyces spiralis]|uniref:Uncharacterized protein n=1 Tax=Streptomyces spiralis TaxID=66376 RepID=A0A918ZQ02_9ACTN|nr:hypothetical protein GCM10014715_15090 [Streptomyces spiralis]
MAAVGEVAGGLERAVGDAVHIGGKGFGHDDDTHTGVVAAPDVNASTSIFPAEERPMSVGRPTRAGQPVSMRPCLAGHRTFTRRADQGRSETFTRPAGRG